jgi:membrane protease YdiL (CAAX protease family)
MASFFRTIWFTRHGDLRILWRLFLFLLFTGLISVLLVGALYLTGISPEAAGTPVLLVALLAATAIMTRLVNKKPFRAAGLPLARGSARDFALGCFLGLLMMAGIFLVEFALGYVSLASRGLGVADIIWTLATSGFLFAMAALAEELLFRGYPFQSLMQGLTFLPAALGTSVLFAAAHLRNPEISISGVVNIALAGMWLSIAYLKTRTLWLPFGLHFSWNLCQTTVFSLPTSGIRMEDRMLFSATQQGPDWVTGGSFGPEGGVLATIAIILCTGHILKSSFYRRQQGVITLDSMEDLVPAEGREGGTA